MMFNDCKSTNFFAASHIFPTFFMIYINFYPYMTDLLPRWQAEIIRMDNPRQDADSGHS